jgi:prepilin-type N-terminal cleavage/methylation domain-containing protein
MKFNKKFAFTLGEVLIALSIIGVISALTIPTVIADCQKQTYVTTLKKAYIDLQNNLSVMESENYLKKGLSNSILNRGSDSNTAKTISDTAGKFIKEYYSISKDCGLTAQPCFASEYGQISSTEDTAFTCTTGYSALLKNGVAICIIPTLNTDYATVYIDINGEDLPNIGGRDMFTFNIYEDFSIDEVSPSAISDTSTADDARSGLKDGCSSSYVGAGCFTNIVDNNWKMRY